MRWGVRDEMTNEHMTTDLCMTELRNCQAYSMGPNFIYFGAQKYGYRRVLLVRHKNKSHSFVSYWLLLFTFFSNSQIKK